MEYKNIIPFLVMPLVLLLVEVLAILLTPPVQSAGITAFEDPTSLANPFIFIVILLVFTAFLLLLIKYGKKTWIRAIIALSFFLTFVYIFTALVPVITGDSNLAIFLILTLALIATGILFYYPEWYVIDGLGILIAAGMAAIFGSSLEYYLIILLLALLAAYDAISVYKTKHMITLAEGIIDLKTPILFVIPKKRNYSYIHDGIGKLDDGGERSAFIIGMGDLIMPSLLVVSANVFTSLSGYRLFGMINIPALGAIMGSLAGLGVLLYLVSSGKPQAGLPPLNGGTILGFLVGWALIGFV